MIWYTEMHVFLSPVSVQEKEGGMAVRAPSDYSKVRGNHVIFAEIDSAPIDDRIKSV